MQYNCILIIIIAYNPQQDIIKRYADLPFKFIIVDNSTIPNNLPLKLQSTTNGDYLHNKRNYGIAKALNIGCQYALDNGYKWVITMDQDSIITIDIIDGMIDFANKASDLDQVAIISPRHLMQDDITVDIINEDQEVSNSVLTMTSGNLLNLNIWKKINGFEDKLFIDMVDLDYYCRAMIGGYKVLTLNKLLMQHNLGELKAKKILRWNLKPLNHSYIRKYYQIRNGLYVYNKYKKQIPELHMLSKFLFKSIIISTVFEKDILRKYWFIIRGYIDFLRKKLGPLNVK